jgi:hypothetical protein
MFDAFDTNLVSAQFKHTDAWILFDKTCQIDTSLVAKVLVDK